MRWEYDSPEKKLFLADGKTVWFYVPYDHTVTKASGQGKFRLAHAAGLADGQSGSLAPVQQRGLDRAEGSSRCHVILRCLPKGEKQTPSPAQAGSSQAAAGPAGDVDFTEVLLEVDKSSGELARIEIRQPGQIELEYRFGSWQEDIPLADSMFRVSSSHGRCRGGWDRIYRRDRNEAASRPRINSNYLIIPKFVPGFTHAAAC